MYAVTNPRGNLQAVIYLLAGIASLGGVLFGYQTGVAAGALHLASNAWAVDGRYLVLLSTGTLIGALVGALSSGKLADLIGRRDVIMATAALDSSTKLRSSTGWATMTGSVRVSATIDERERLRRLRFLANVRYSGPYVIVENPDGSRSTEYGLPSANDALAYHAKRTTAS